MSRYQAMCVAIELCESARKVIGKDPEGRETASEIIRELQDVARDVRYGGKWEGDCEEIARSMEYCAENRCEMCPYKKMIDQGCRRELKKIAAEVIRQLEQQKKEMEEKIAAMEKQIAEMRGDAYDSDFPPKEPAEWQKEIMNAMEGKEPPF